MSEIKIKFIGEDNWGRQLYQNVENPNIYAVVDGWYYTTTSNAVFICNKTSRPLFLLRIIYNTFTHS